MQSEIDSHGNQESRKEKNMKLSWKTLGLAAICVSALIVVTAAVVVSQGPGGFQRGPGGPRGGGLPFLRNLNLTDAQKAEIKKIMDSEAASTRDLHDQL